MVVASAGGSSTIGPITQVDAQAFRDTMDLNVVGTFLALKHAAPVMIRGGGGLVHRHLVDRRVDHAPLVRGLRAVARRASRR